MRIVPLYDQILVLETKQEQTMDGVILPETSKEDVHFGKVISIGRGYIQPDGTYRPMSLVVGNTIAYGQYAGIPAQVGGVEFLVMKEGEALFLLNDEEAT